MSFLYKVTPGCMECSESFSISEALLHVEETGHSMLLLASSPETATRSVPTPSEVHERIRGLLHEAPSSATPPASVRRLTVVNGTKSDA